MNMWSHGTLCVLVCLTGWSQPATEAEKIFEPRPPTPALCLASDRLDLGLTSLCRWLIGPGPELTTRGDEPNRTILRLSPTYRIDADGRSQLKLSGQADIDLPLFNDWLDIRFGELDVELNDFVTSTEKLKFWEDLSLDMRWNNGLESRLRGRLGVTWNPGPFWSSIDQSIWYRTDRGFGTQSRLRAVYRLGEGYDRLHAESSADYEEESHGFRLRQTAGWYRDLPKFKRVGIRAVSEEFTGPSDLMGDAVYLRAFARAPITRRVFLRIEPGLAWRNDEDDDEVQPTLLVRLETFWGLIDQENLQKFYLRP